MIFFHIFMLTAVTVNSVAITSGGSATFVRVGNKTSGSVAIEQWVAFNIVGGTTPTVQATLSATATGEIVMYEFQGPAAENQDGVTITNTGTSVTPSSGNFSTTVNNDLLMKTLYCAGGGTVAEGSWTDLIPTLGGNCTGYVIKGTAGSTVANCTQGSSAAWIAVAAAFKPFGPALPGAPASDQLYLLKRQRLSQPP